MGLVIAGFIVYLVIDICIKPPPPPSTGVQ